MLVIPKWQPSGFTSFKIVKRHPHWIQRTFCCSRFWKIKMNWSLLLFLPCLQVELRFHALWWLLLPTTIRTRVMHFYFPFWFPARLVYFIDCHPHPIPMDKTIHLRSSTPQLTWPIIANLLASLGIFRLHTWMWLM
jgi:hypothetical protein